MINKLTLSVLTIVLAVSLVVLIGGCGKSGEKKPEAKSEAVQSTGHEGHDHGMSAEGLTYIYTAEHLYTCDNHPILISGDPEAMCPRCEVKLTQMSDEAVAELRTSHPKGCPMCSIVVPGDSRMNACPKCGMDLVSIPNPEEHMHQ